MRFSQSTHLHVFVFGDFNVHHKYWQTYSGGTERLSELCYNFSITNYPTQMVAWVPDCDSHSPPLLDLFLSSDTSIGSTMTLPQFQNSHHVVVSVSIDFPSDSKWDALFHRIAYAHADWSL